MTICFPPGCLVSAGQVAEGSAKGRRNARAARGIVLDRPYLRGMWGETSLNVLFNVSLGESVSTCLVPWLPSPTCVWGGVCVCVGVYNRPWSKATATLRWGVEQKYTPGTWVLAQVQLSWYVNKKNLFLSMDCFIPIPHTHARGSTKMPTSKIPVLSLASTHGNTHIQIDRQRRDSTSLWNKQMYKGNAGPHVVGRDAPIHTFCGQFKILNFFYSSGLPILMLINLLDYGIVVYNTIFFILNPLEITLSILVPE